MTWHAFPHMPEEGAHILAKFKNCPKGNLIEMTIRDIDSLTHVEKWCYYDDYDEIRSRTIQNFQHVHAEEKVCDLNGGEGII